MSRKIIKVIAIILFLGGSISLLYPRVTRWFSQREMNATIAEFEDKKETEGNYDELYKALQEYNRNLYETGQKNLTDPFAYEEAGFNLKAHGFEEDIIGYLDIPQMKVKMPVYLGASDTNLEKGGAIMTQTSIPIGGENTNAVIAAHRGWVEARMFQDIDKMAQGDFFTLTNFRETLTYQVIESKIIDPSAVDEVLIRPGKDIITLLTCHPYGRNHQRYVVYCERVAKTQDD